MSGLRSCVILVSMRPETTCPADECKIGISAILIRRTSHHAYADYTTPVHIQLALFGHTTCTQPIAKSTATEKKKSTAMEEDAIFCWPSAKQVSLISLVVCVSLASM